MKYFANFSANNGTSLMKSIESNNLKEITRCIKRIASAERFFGNVARWWVRDKDGHCIACGHINNSGNHNDEPND